MAVAREARVDIEPFDLERSFALQRFGQWDPTATGSHRKLQKAFSAPHGPCVVEIATASKGVTISATGPDADDVVTDLAAGLGADDGYGAFAPEHPLLAK